MATADDLTEDVISNYLPPWTTSLRPSQVTAIQEVVSLVESGCKVVFLDGPTGTGKTLIGEMVGRVLGYRRNYVCNALTLQDQFLRDFPEAALLKGRSNYAGPYATGDQSCADCTGKTCFQCDGLGNCPYTVAKRTARSAEVAVLNTAYMFNEWNYVGEMSGRQLTIVDEADVLEQQLMGFTEFRVSARALQRLGLNAPTKGVHKSTIRTWMEGPVREALEAGLVGIPRDPGLRSVSEQRWVTTMGNIRGGVESVLRDLESERWVRDYATGGSGGARATDGDGGGFVLKPVLVADVGPDSLWQHSDHFLCMSATLISAAEMAESLGLEATGEAWGEVIVPMTFPAYNRPLFICPVANMSKAGQESGSMRQVMPVVVNIIKRYDDDTSVLIHSVSYKLTQELEAGLKEAGLGGRVVSYQGAKQREYAKRKFERTRGAILIAPSMDRGVDFADDKCRVQIVPKIPFPNLGDRMVGTRMHLPGGQVWYRVQTIRTLVQMTGRGVRSPTDWCDTWILDSQFTRNILKESRSLLPAWWREAMVLDFPIRELIYGQ